MPRRACFLDDRISKKPRPSGRASGSTALQVANTLNHQMSLKDLPDEVISIILQVSGFAELRKVVRLCRRWRFLVYSPDVSRDIYLDRETIAEFTAHVSRCKAKKLPLGTGCGWIMASKFAENVFVTGNTDCHRDQSSPPVRELLQLLCARCPSIVNLHFTDCETECILQWCSFPEITRLNVTVTNFFTPLTDIGSPGELGFGQLNPASRRHKKQLTKIFEPWLLRIPKIPEFPGSELDTVLRNVTWTLGQDRTDWLAANIQAMNKNSRVTNWALVQIKFRPETEIVCSRKSCTLFRKFCPDIYPGRIMEGAFGNRLLLVLFCLLQKTGAAVKPPRTVEFFRKDSKKLPEGDGVCIVYKKHDLSLDSIFRLLCC